MRFLENPKFLRNLNVLLLQALPVARFSLFLPQRVYSENRKAKGDYEESVLTSPISPMKKSSVKKKEVVSQFVNALEL